MNWRDYTPAVLIVVGFAIMVIALITSVNLAGMVGLVVCALGFGAAYLMSEEPADPDWPFSHNPEDEP